MYSFNVSREMGFESEVLGAMLALVVLLVQVHDLYVGFQVAFFDKVLVAELALYPWLAFMYMLDMNLETIPGLVHHTTVLTVELLSVLVVSHHVFHQISRGLKLLPALRTLVHRMGRQNVLL